ncbi:MAG: hypothetical protein ABIH23_09315 [bacterium]
MNARIWKTPILNNALRSIRIVFLLLVAPMTAHAHPMGNFTLNHTAILELTGNRIIHHALLDFAEVPSFEQFSAIDADGDRIVTPDELKGYLDRLVPEITLYYDLRVEGKKLESQLIEYTPRLYPGVVRVTCLQILIRLEAALPEKPEKLEIQFDNRAYADRMGKSSVRLLWSPDLELTGVESIPPPGKRAVEPLADFEQSWLLQETRSVRFSVRNTGHPTRDYKPLESKFSAIDPYLAFELAPQEILHPDEQGRYEIFHVKLAQNASVSPLPPVVQAKPIEEPPQSTETIGQDEDLSKTDASPPAVKTIPQRPQPDGARKLGEAERKFSELIHTENVGPSTLLVMILLSIMYGAAHALSPGHGKTIVAAYLVGTQGNLWRGLVQAVYLGIIVTLSHVFVVLAVGIIALTLTSGALSPEVTVSLQIASGLLVMSIGIPMIVRRSEVYFQAKVLAVVSVEVPSHPHPHPHNHSHAHDHDHHHPHTHSHDTGHDHHHLPTDASWWDLLVLGVTGGMVPCLGAVVVFLIGAGYGKIALGVMLIVSFSMGLAAVLIAIGISMVLCKQLLNRVFDWFDTRWGRKEGSARTFFQLGMPIIASVLITLLGAGICIRALIQGGYLVINLG